MLRSISYRGLSKPGFASIGAALLFLGASGLVSPSDAQMFPVQVRPTSIVRGPAESPASILDVRLVRAITRGAIEIRHHDGGQILFALDLGAQEAGHRFLVPVPYPPAGTEGRVTVLVEEPGSLRFESYSYPRASLDWTLHFVPGFHYDPVWWNTQAHYTETGRYMDAHVGPGHTLLEEYLDICDSDADYKVAIHQLPYLKTFFEARSAEVARIEALVRAGRLGVVGGSYNESSTTLVSAEATARNAIYGCLFQREIVGGRGSVFWQCDVFGHDPSFPSLMARSGHTGGGFARGPFHQWGAPRDQVNFPSEFWWMAPDGEKILTHYMTGHYGYAYSQFAPGSNRAPDDAERCNLIIASMFEDLKRPALTHHVLLPMHMDFIRPLENLGEVLREWNRTYLSPRAVIDTSEGFFREVEAEIAARDISVPVITRDMNPIYTGCPVSFADLKTANRAGEVTLREAEIFATIATLEGARYPSLAIDRAWRQLLFNAHHDGVTGSMSDQVYVDLMLAYRDALEIARAVRSRALAYLSSKVDTRGATSDGPLEREAAVATRVFWNSTSAMSRAVSGGMRADVAVLGGGVPAVGYRTVRGDARGRAASVGTVLENELLRVTLDPARGGTLSSIIDKRSGRELLRGAGNDLVVHEEYPVLPGHGEGPWHLAPTGDKRAGSEVSASIEPIALGNSVEPGALRIVASYPEFRKEQVVRLVPGEARIDFETKIVDWKGRDQLLRVEFPCDLPGARPVFQTAASVIGRPFARDVDTAKDSWTLDQTCWQWVALGTTCALVVGEPEQPVYRRALGVAEIVVGEAAAANTRELANRLAEALVRCGVTSTITREGDRRYGDLQFDSNAPDFRLLLGSAAEHAWIRRLCEQTPLDPSRGSCVVALDGDLPLVLLPATEAHVAELTEALATHHEVYVPRERAFLESTVVAPRYTVALINQGAVSAHVSEDGTLGLNLLRSCTSWPSGVWIDPPARRLPDGNPFGTMHGSHVYRYSLVVHPGDYRAADLSRVAQQVNHPLVEHAEPVHGGSLPAAMSFVTIDDPAIRLAALKPIGFPEAVWSEASPRRQDRIVARLWNGGGRWAQPTVRMPRHTIVRAWRANLLEQRERDLEVVEGGVRLSMPPHAYETLVLEVTSQEVDPQAPSLDPTDGDVSSSAYWLEDLAEGVTGNGVVGIHPAARRMTLEDGRATLELSVQNHRRNAPATIDLRLETDPNLAVSVEPRRVVIGPNAQATVQLRCEAPTGRPKPGEATLITIIANGVGEREVTAAVWVVADGSSPADGGEIEIQVPVPAATSGSKITALLVNHTDGPITGLAEWMTPFALWEGTPAWRERVSVPPRGTATVALALDQVHASYALLRFTYGGRIAYGETVAVLDDRRDVVLDFGQDRVRLRQGESARVKIRARGFEGVTVDTPLTLAAPAGWTVLDRGRVLVGSGPLHTVEAAFDVTPAGTGVRGTLTARGPRESRARVAYTVSPQQAARPRFSEVSVDGKLDEWHVNEFTEAHDELGRVRTAVRYGAAGLALALRVEDDRFVQTHTSARIWEGDSIQFSLSVAPATSVGYAHTDLEFGAALTPIGPLLWCWYGGEGGQTGRLESASVAVVRQGSETLYEIALPRSVLPKLSLEPGAVLGFGYIANDDDGAGYRGATQWTPGMVGGKDASLFGELTLVAE
ncbi:MAG: glycoside hydrolase family 38 C-terminal domain-containing protein [Planctomycetota bacterium]